MSGIDFSSDTGRHALERLQREQIIWLTTVSPQGRPQSSPVWFLWRDGTFVIYSQPTMPKLKAIRGNDHVSLNLNSSETGEDVVIFEGTARIVGQNSPATDDPVYVEKYARLIDGWTRDDFAATFSEVIHVSPTRMRVY